jgi:hypothetical protein
MITSYCKQSDEDSSAQSYPIFQTEYRWYFPNAASHDFSLPDGQFPQLAPGVHSSPLIVYISQLRYVDHTAWISEFCFVFSLLFIPNYGLFICFHAVLYWPHMFRNNSPVWLQSRPGFEGSDFYLKMFLGFLTRRRYFWIISQIYHSILLWNFNLTLLTFSTSPEEFSYLFIHSRSRKPKLTAVGIRCADHATPSIRKGWH